MKTEYTYRGPCGKCYEVKMCKLTEKGLICMACAGDDGMEFLKGMFGFK